MIAPGDGSLDFKQSALTCHSLVRGLSMWPGTYCYLKLGDAATAKMKVGRTRVGEGRGESGRGVTWESKGEKLEVVCGDGSVLEILELQPEARKMIKARDFINGLKGDVKIAWTEEPFSP